ncbi:MAG: sigma-70 family RNA polymerase sigma factor [Colwellia sp.]|nr:sigma-70 family RNA polymerase sigma factor [Colwellia sp.]
MTNESLSEQEISQQREQKLIIQLKANNDDAFEQLVRDYSDRMYAICCRYFSCRDDAQECLQKAFIQVFKHIHTFKEESQLATWLHRITVNCALMQLRSQQRQQAISLELCSFENAHLNDFSQHYNSFGERTVFANSDGNNIEALFEQEQMKANLSSLIFQLPEKYCNVLLLRDIQELSTKESAHILALSESAVKTQLHRARLLLKAMLTAQKTTNHTTKHIKNDC